MSGIDGSFILYNNIQYQLPAHFKAYDMQGVNNGVFQSNVHKTKAKSVVGLCLLRMSVKVSTSLASVL